MIVNSGKLLDDVLELEEENRWPWTDFEIGVNDVIFVRLSTL